MRMCGENKMKNIKKIIFIRHGETIGNLKKRYIGRTDEPLCSCGISKLKTMEYPTCDIVICSPMLRCVQTAQIIYPNNKMLIYENLRECDFGSFEGKNYIELSRDPDYAKWVESRGTLPFPYGEAQVDFKSRCIEAFYEAMSDNDYTTTAFIIHGGCIMAIMEKYALPRREFYDYQVQNCHGFLTEFDGNNLTINREI